MNVIVDSQVAIFNEHRSLRFCHKRNNMLRSTKREEMKIKFKKSVAKQDMKRISFIYKIR